MSPSKPFKVYKWDLARSQKRETLELLLDTQQPFSEDHDAAREDAKAQAVALFGGRARACSALVGGGFAIVIDLVPRK